MTSAYELERIRRCLRCVEIRHVFRLIPDQYATMPFGVGSAPSRFSDPAGVFSVLYAAADIATAFWEGLVRHQLTRRKRRKLSRSEIDTRLIVKITATEPLNLVDLRDDAPIRIGAPTAITHDTNHAAGRAFSAEIYLGLPEADGLLYESRFTGQACIAVYDRAIGKLEAVSTAPLGHHAEFLAALTDYEITLVEAPVTSRR